jgi:hypothetical protein
MVLVLTPKVGVFDERIVEVAKIDVDAVVAVVFCNCGAEISRLEEV